MDILGSLGNLVTQAGKLSLPGVVAAIAFALLLWPPDPYDRIPEVLDNRPALSTSLIHISDVASLDAYLKRSDPACNILRGCSS